MFYFGVIVQYNSNLVITARNWRGMIWTQHQLLFWISQCWRSMHEKKKTPMCKNINLILTLSLCSSNWEYAIYLYPRAALERHNFTYLDGAIKRKEGKCKLTALSQGNFACNWLTGLHWKSVSSFFFFVLQVNMSSIYCSSRLIFNTLPLYFPFLGFKQPARHG